jgi:hypothetical protein
MRFVSQEIVLLPTRNLLALLVLTSVCFIGCSNQAEQQGGKDEQTNQAQNRQGQDEQVQGQEQQREVDRDVAAVAKPLDLAYIPETAMAAAVVAPDRILSSSALQLYPIEVLEALTEHHLGINIMDVTQIVGLAQLSQEAPVPQAGAIIRLSKPHQLAKLLPTLRNEGMVREQEIDGFQFLNLNAGLPVSVAMPDEKTVLVGTGDFLSHMLAAKNAQSPLLKLLSGADANDEVIVTLSADMVPAPLREIATNPEMVPPAFASYVNALEKLSALEVKVDFSETFNGELVLHTHDQAEAAELEKVILAGLAQGKQLFLAQATQMPPMGDPVVDAAMRKYMLRLADYMEQVFHPTRDTNRLTMDSNATIGIATTGVMVALLLPAVQSARTAARKMSSGNNLKQIAIALHNYHETYKQFPVGESPNIKYKDGKPLLSWRVHLLPFLEEIALYQKFKLDEPWNSPHNIKLLDEIPPVYVCPHYEVGNQTVYLAPQGPNTAMGGAKRIRFRDITDGTSQTIAVIETGPGRAIPWTKPDDLAIDEDDPVGSVGAERETFQVVFCDGSVQSISAAISGDIFQWMIQINDGHPINLNE